MTPEMQAWFDAAGTLSLTTVLVLAVVWFYRGDILPRKVYEELLKRMITEIVHEIKDEMKIALREVLKEELGK